MAQPFNMFSRLFHSSSNGKQKTEMYLEQYRQEQLAKEEQLAKK